MALLAYIYKFCLNIVYLFFKLFKTRKQITFISRQSDHKSIDIILLEKELNKELKDFEIITLCKTIKPSILGKISYFFYIFKLMFHISRSKIVILDSYCIPISILKHKKDLIVIQMWHAIGLMKKAGYASINLKEGRKKSLAKAMNMHKNYDLVFASSKKCIKPISEVFNIDKDKVLVQLLPRVDLLKDNNYIDNRKQIIFKKYPKCKEKINIVYVPTFRKNSDLLIKKIYELINSVDYQKYNLIIKLHPNSNIEIKDKRVIIDNYFNSLDMLLIADYVISDYSAIIYESCILNKPIAFYAFDLDDYDVRRGFFINYKEEVPGIILDNAKELLDKFLNSKYDYKKAQVFINNYIDFKDNEQTKEIVMLIKKYLKK